MSKYDPLKRHLSSLMAPEWKASFRDVERVLGFPLPPSSRRHRAVWSNNPQNHAMTRAWLEAGWRTEQVDLEAAKVTFRKAGPQPPAFSSGRPPSPFGGLKGTVQIAADTDLTEPSGEDWSAQQGHL
jgi:hypothetical protein